jgi:hypothetical protein
MTTLEAFQEYYTLYRGDSDVPATTDDEWTIFIRLANSSIARWDRVEDALWDELWSTLQVAADGTKVVATATSSYVAPTNFRFPGGNIRIYSGTSQEMWIPLIEPEELENHQNGTVAWFTGSGVTKTLNLRIAGTAPTVDYNGWNIDYQYYKAPTALTTADTGTTVLEMSDPYFVVHDTLANRLRTSRNWPAYQTAKRDAEEALSNMQLRNNMGTHNAPWSLNLNGGFGDNVASTNTIGW